MKIDLNDKIVRFVVQEYANKIINYTNNTELDYHLHKLIHTFQVVQTAQDLIDLTKPALPAKTKKLILNAAVLHDVGRCYEFRNGVLLKKTDHGQIGAQLIKKHFPSLNVEIESTRFHNKLPSDKDKTFGLPVLDYVRDSDMLGNIRYQINHPDIFIKHLLPLYIGDGDEYYIDPEIKKAARERRGYRITNCKRQNFLTMVLGQVTWAFLLRTKAGEILDRKQKLFIKFRDMVIESVLPELKGSKQEKEKAKKDILSLFSDDVLERKGDK